MTDAQYAEILRRLTRIEAKQDRLARTLHNHDIKADGEAEGNRPWLKLKPQRCAQVQKVYECLLAHKGDKDRTMTIAEACRMTFAPRRGGYPTLSALESYCYSVPVTQFV